MFGSVKWIWPRDKSKDKSWPGYNLTAWGSSQRQQACLQPYRLGQQSEATSLFTTLPPGAAVRGNKLVYNLTARGSSQRQQACLGQQSEATSLFTTLPPGAAVRGNKLVYNLTAWGSSQRQQACLQPYRPGQQSEATSLFTTLPPGAAVRGNKLAPDGYLACT